MYYPGSGTDFSPLRLFAEHGQYSTIVYADYGVTRDDALRFPRSIPGWTSNGEPESLDPSHFGANSWEDFWPTNPDSRQFAKPESAFVLRNHLQSQAGHEALLLFLGTEATQTYSVLIAAGIEPTAVVLQDHGFGGNWSQFGGRSALYDHARDFGHKPNLLLVAEDTSPWPGYKRASTYSTLDGQMHNHARAIFAAQ